MPVPPALAGDSAGHLLRLHSPANTASRVPAPHCVMQGVAEEGQLPKSPIKLFLLYLGCSLVSGLSRLCTAGPAGNQCSHWRPISPLPRHTAEILDNTKILFYPDCLGRSLYFYFTPSRKTLYCLIRLLFCDLFAIVEHFLDPENRIVYRLARVGPGPRLAGRRLSSQARPPPL